jgi:hypothetical protein
MKTSEHVRARIAWFCSVVPGAGEVTSDGVLLPGRRGEHQAAELADALSAALVAERAKCRSPTDQKASCPERGQRGCYRGDRQRELLSRRGPGTIRESEYYCPACGRAFFLMTRRISVEPDCPFVTN